MRGPESVNTGFRRERFKHFVELTKRISSNPLRILDLGGEEDYWRDKIPMLDRPAAITLVNIREIEVSLPGLEMVSGDVRSLSRFSDHSFDVVHSNSVIEHVGQWRDMQAMASEVRRLAPAYFVQTPYFWFPVEPHFRTVGFQWLPEPFRARILMHCGLGFFKKCSTFDEAMRAVQDSSLLDWRMFSTLFPDAELRFERWMGLPKSMMAIRG
jgi:hypothetical protein